MAVGHELSFNMSDIMKYSQLFSPERAEFENFCLILQHYFLAWTNEQEGQVGIKSAKSYILTDRIISEIVIVKNS